MPGQLVAQMYRVKVLDGAAETTSPPSAASDGVELPLRQSDSGKIFILSTAGSGDMSVSISLWGWDPGIEAWFDMGPLNKGDEIDESGDDLIAHVEPVYGLTGITRAALQVTAIAGTGTTVDAWIGREVAEQRRRN